MPVLLVISHVFTYANEISLQVTLRDLSTLDLRELRLIWPEFYRTRTLCLTRVPVCHISYSRDNWDSRVSNELGSSWVKVRTMSSGTILWTVTVWILLFKSIFSSAVVRRLQYSPALLLLLLLLIGNGHKFTRGPPQCPKHNMTIYPIIFSHGKILFNWFL